MDEVGEGLVWEDLIEGDGVDEVGEGLVWEDLIEGGGVVGGPDRGGWDG